MESITIVEVDFTVDCTIRNFSGRGEIENSSTSRLPNTLSSWITINKECYAFYKIYWDRSVVSCWINELVT